MTVDGNGQIADRISAYLDGALPAAERLKLEAEMATDPALAAEVEALRQVDAALKRGFADMLNDPVPLQLARSIEATAAPAPTAPMRAPQRWGGLRSIAAGLALIGLGAGLGAIVTRAVTPPQVIAEAAPGWLDQVAEYHAVYAAQGRHLVEVPASEQAHLETWLADQTGVPFTVPDLTASGLTFQGARLLVANGKPVAQLMYKDAGGQVVAVCFMTGGDAALAEDEIVFADRQIGTFDLVSWKDRTASYVVIGPSGRQDLRRIAETAAIAL
jgi:anti-sigma factor RsiW